MTTAPTAAPAPFAGVPASPVDHEGWASHWDGYAAVYEDVAFGGAGVRWVADLELAAMHAALPTDRGRVLDAGAGTGRVTRSLLAAGWDVTAMDVSPGMLAQLHASSPEVRTVVARLGSPLPLPDASFDAVVSLRVLKYVDDPSLGLRELARVLRPGGTAVVELANRRSVARWGYGDAPVRLLTVDQFAAMARAAGLTVDGFHAGTRLPHRAWLAATSERALAVARAGERVAAAILPGTALARSVVAVLRR